MLPYIIGTVIFATTIYLLNEAEEENTLAKDVYEETKLDSILKIKENIDKAKVKIDNDRYYKQLKLKQKFIKMIDKELKILKTEYRDINLQLRDTKILLDKLFNEKKIKNRREDKREIQKEINIVIELRKELFKIRDSTKKKIISISNRKTSL